MGLNVEKIGTEKGEHGNVGGQKQGHKIIVTTANTMPGTVLDVRPVKFPPHDRVCATSCLLTPISCFSFLHTPRNCTSYFCPMCPPPLDCQFWDSKDFVLLSRVVSGAQSGAWCSE